MGSEERSLIIGDQVLIFKTILSIVLPACRGILLSSFPMIS